MPELPNPSTDTCDIRDVVAQGWCTGCTTCVGVCPARALTVQTTRYGAYVPVLDPQQCTQCGLCRKVCPAANENFHTLNEFVFGSVPRDILLGHQQGCYLGYATDEHVRWQATSGGLVTALLLHLLDRDHIDGALLTRMAADDPLRAEPFIARSAEDVRSAIGSKYLPVPLNQWLRTVIEEPGRYAVVGLPCHLHGIRRAEMHLPILKERLVYHFGLVCSHTMSAEGVRFILNKMGIPQDDVHSVLFRGDGWPSGLRVRTKAGREKYMPNLDSWWSEAFGRFAFSHEYCLICSDQTNEFSDISFADAWLTEILRNDKKGTSIVVARTLSGRALLDDAVSSGIAVLDTLSPKSTVQSQWFMTLFKKRNIVARVALDRMMGRPTPVDLVAGDRFLPPTGWDWLTAWVPRWNLTMSRRRPALGLFGAMPLGLLKLMRRMYKWFLVRGAQRYL